jgi:hypothetical protein
MKCYELHRESPSSCKNTECKYWIKHRESNNCVIISADKGPMTLQSIGDIFGITRMRVCQIEKKILSKIKPFILNKNQIGPLK